MKKFLSLVLALVMTMSLVTISAGAKTFEDDDAIDYTEAVEVMKAVKVIDGYADGSFNPSATLTRGAAAKIICNLILGPTTAGALKADAAPYKDVPAGSTFAGYIAYCQKEGIISGYADGTFKPGNTLTGYAFMKMLLGALGYDKATEGYEGANWSINVAKRALYVGLDDGLTADFNGVKAVTREEACLYAFNTLNAQTVKYTGGNSVTVNGITFTNGGQLQENMGLFRVKYFPKLQPTTEVAKNGAPSTSWKYDRKDVGTYAEAIDATYNKKVAQKDVYSALGLTTDPSTFETTKLSTTVTGVANGTQAIGKDVSTKIGANGVVLDFYADADNSRYYMTETHPIIAKIASVGKNDDGDRVVNIAGYNAYKTDDFAKGDWVILTTKKASTGTDIATMVAGEKLTGTVTKLVGSDEIYIDGTKYTLSASEGKDLDLTVAVKDEVEFYLDANGYVLKLDKASTSVSLKNLAYVEKAGEATDSFDSAYKAILRLPDGSKTTVETDIDYSVYETGKHLVTYKVDSDGKTVLEQDTDKYYYYTTNADFVKGQPTIAGDFADYNDSGATSLLATSSTTFVYVTTNAGKTTVKVYEGYKNAPSFTNADNVEAFVKDGKAVCVYVVTNDSALAGETTDQSFVIFNTSAEKTSEADIVDYYTLAVIENGEIKDVKLDSSDWGTLQTAALSDHYVTGWTTLKGMKDGSVQTNGSMSSSLGTNYTSIEVTDNGETIALSGGVSMAVSSTAKIYVVNKDCDKITAGDIDSIADGTAGSANTDFYKDIFVARTEAGKNVAAVIIVVEKW